MHTKIMTMVCLLFFAGCATSQKTLNTEMQIQEMKSRISYLETDLERKAREIARFQERIERNQDSRMSIHQENVVMKDDDIDGDGSEIPIKDIQKALKNAGLYQGAIDGKMGSQTKEGVMKFQKDNRLKVDGIVGSQTWLCLRRYLKSKGGKK